MPRAVPSLAAVLLLLMTASRAACGEEVFVLDNGMVLRGVEVRRGAEGVVIRLTDLASAPRVTVAESRIVKRYGAEEPSSPVPSLALLHATDTAPPARRPGPETAGPSTRAVPLPAPPPLALEEAVPRAETFFQRLDRLARMALPADGLRRLALALLAYGVLVLLVVIGGQLLEISRLGLRQALVVAAAFGALLAAFLLRPESLLLAERALWLMPLLAAGYLGISWAVLRAPLRQVVLLFAYLGFSVCVVVFASGAVLMIC